MVCTVWTMSTLHAADLALELSLDLALSDIPAFIKTYCVTLCKESCDELRRVLAELGEIECGCSLDEAVVCLLAGIDSLVVDEALVDSAVDLVCCVLVALGVCVIETELNLIRRSCL